MLLGVTLFFVVVVAVIVTFNIINMKVIFPENEKTMTGLNKSFL